MQRAQNIRMTGLAAVALLAVAVPLGAAMAGPAEESRPRTPGPGAGAPAAGTAENSPSVAGVDAAERGSGADGRRTGAVRSPRSAGRPADRSRGLGLPLRSGRTAHCGPALGSGRGIEAQTCVLAERGRTWARTYYRNRTGSPLRAVLTLLRPDGRTLQVTCDVPAADVPGGCETPAGATVLRGRPGYGAVAEIADASGERLRLRAGSNSAVGGSGSGR
ncbi:hypothetical protein [Streptomyces sp. NPDC020742]|uniref:hypothetical protein n=1 Tax=Streptomyces sp. NPDC020742 TaxID=3154897 RepID=UPI003402F4EA